MEDATRIVSWNCNMAAHRKMDQVISLRPDVAILAECAGPDVAAAKPVYASASGYDWIGKHRTKGIAGLAFGNYKLEPVWTQQSLAEALLAKTGVEVSRSTVQRALRARGLRSHRVRQWLHSPDPRFRELVQRICNLYLHPPRDAVVISIDEKPMQALFRRFPNRVFEQDGSLRREFEYVREGTCTLLGAMEVGAGRVFGHVVKKRGVKALVSFMEAIARRYPGRQVYVVWDNLNTHFDGKDRRWTRFNERHQQRFHFVYTPKHASWVNQIEIWFSILHRRVLKHGSFSGVPDLRAAVLGFIRFWNVAPRPFRWTFTGDFAQPSLKQAA